MKRVVTQGRRLWIKHGKKYLLHNFLRHIKLPDIALELLQIPNGWPHRNDLPNLRAWVF